MPRGRKPERRVAFRGPGAHSTGPDASGPAAYGLCQAYLAGGLHHDGNPPAQALAAAAGGADKVTDYCEGVVGAKHSAANHRRSASS